MNKRVTLREYFESRIKSIELARKVAYESMEARLNGMNEFRETLKDQASRFITREEVDLKFESLDKGRKDNVALIVSILALIIGLVGTVIGIK